MVGLQASGGIRFCITLAAGPWHRRLVGRHWIGHAPSLAGLCRMVDASRMGLVCLLVYMGPFPLLWTMLLFPARRGAICGFCQCRAGMAITGHYLCH